MKITYSRTNDFRYGRQNESPALTRIELTTSATARVPVTYKTTRAPRAEQDISLSPFAPENLVSVRPSRPASACSFSPPRPNLVPTHGLLFPIFRGGVHSFIASTAIGSISGLSGHENAKRWRSPLRVRRHGASSPQDSSSNGCCPFRCSNPMDNWIFASDVTATNMLRKRTMPLPTEHVPRPCFLLSSVLRK